jgi:hypothetical protein
VTAPSCYAELVAEAYPERDNPSVWKVSGIIGLSPTAAPYASEAEADAELAGVLLRAFRQAQAYSR